MYSENISAKVIGQHVIGDVLTSTKNTDLCLEATAMGGKSGREKRGERRSVLRASCSVAKRGSTSYLVGPS